VGARVARNPSQFGEGLFQVRDHLYQVWSLHNKAVGILQKGTFRTVIAPEGHAPEAFRILVLAKDTLQEFTVHSDGEPCLPGLFGQGVDHLLDRVYILFDVIQGAQGKPGVFIYRTKITTIPWAAASDANQKAFRFTGRSDGALFRAECHAFSLEVHLEITRFFFLATVLFH